MSTSKIVCLVAIALILVVAFYRCPKKSGGFRVVNEQGYNALPMEHDKANRPTLTEFYPPISGLEASRFRPGDDSPYRSLVDQVPAPGGAAKANLSLPKYDENVVGSGRESMEGAAMDEMAYLAQSQSYVPSVQLRSTHYACDQIFNVGLGHGVYPKSSGRDHFNNDSRYNAQYDLLIGTTYDQDGQLAERRMYDAWMKGGAPMVEKYDRPSGTFDVSTGIVSM